MSIIFTRTVVDGSRGFKFDYTVAMPKNKCEKNIQRFFGNFCKKTTIHGLNIITLPNLHILERFAWF